MVDNGICRLYPDQYNDIFSFTDNADYEGEVIQGDRTLQLYSYSEKTRNGGKVYFSLLADGNIPVNMNITVDNPAEYLVEALYFSVCKQSKYTFSQLINIFFLSF